MSKKKNKKIKKEDKKNVDENTSSKNAYYKIIDFSFFENSLNIVLFPIVYSIVALFNITTIAFIAYKVQSPNVNVFIKTFFIILMISSASTTVLLLIFRATKLENKYNKSKNKRDKNEFIKLIKSIVCLFAITFISSSISYSNQNNLFEFINQHSTSYFITIMIISIFLTIKIIKISYKTTNKVRNNFINSRRNRSIGIVGILIVATSAIIPLLSNVSQILDLLDKIIKLLPFK